ncbi:1,2-diacylglycerol 3-beta-glucosyltransferase [Streptacidiphilus sp. MAP12-20]|uniref:glycosyltransferase n=1 Tax=Streptacidiphilus sp. MAP12-20 TaxID=3156299 RepID=UPI003519023F
MTWPAFSAIALVVICFAAAYSGGVMVLGMLEWRRRGLNLPEQSDARYGRPSLGRASDDPYWVYYLVPCLNEAAVIQATVRGLTGPERSTLVVIDDGSDDATSQLAREAGGADLVLLRRDLPNARKGKGAALNAGLLVVRELARERGQDPAQVIVCVMDADGRLSDGALARVLPHFDDPRVGGLQLPVRIRNRTSMLLWYQDFCFWSLAAISQCGRARLRTASLGGNGQFSRLSALEQLGERPWSPSLTEDLDLAVTLAVNGWHLETEPRASVNQQGVDTLRRMLNQRVRWYQGHMTSGRRITEVWRSPHLSNAGALEIVGYLLIPWAVDLPWSILFHIGWYRFLSRAPQIFSFVDGWSTGLLGGLLWYALSFLPCLLGTWLCLRRSGDVGFWRAFALGHNFVLMNYIAFVCVWRALFRILLRRQGWAKTVRVDETARVPEPASAGATAPAEALPTAGR